MSTSYTRSTRKAIRGAVCFIGVCVVLLAAVLRYNTYRQVVAVSEAHTLENLSNVAWMAAQALDGDAHARLTQRYARPDAITDSRDDDDYRALHRALATVATHTGIESPIYTYVLADAETGSGGAVAHCEMAFAVTSAPEPYFRHRFTTHQADQCARFGEAGELGVYEDEFGSWLSAYAPVHDGAGRVVAVVQADEQFDTFIAEARQAALTGIGYDSLFIGGFLCVIGLFVVHVLQRERRDKEALAEAVAIQTELSGALADREADLARNAALLEQSNRDLTDFANIASHDLKSPLRGIASFAQLLARRNRATLDERSNEYLDFILSNASRALKMIDGLLSYAKVDQGERSPERFKACDAVRAAEQNLYATLQERGAELRIEGTIPFLVADLTLVTQVFQNLISNGTKYNEQARPTVRISAGRTESGEVFFSVRDNGIGIPEEYQSHVFDMFRRVHAGEQYEGSGIGLAFCMRVVNRYGGTMWVESTEGEGSCFYFTLPEAIAAEELVVGELV